MICKPKYCSTSWDRLWKEKKKGEKKDQVIKEILCGGWSSNSIKAGYPIPRKEGMTPMLGASKIKCLRTSAIASPIREAGVAISVVGYGVMGFSLRRRACKVF